MRQTLLSGVKTSLAVLALSVAGSAAHAQSVGQSFESAATDTWAYTPTPATYNDLAATDQWAVLTTIGTAGSGLTVATPSAGANLWGGRDLEGPLTANASIWHYLDFAPVAIQTGSTAANTITFKYFSNALDNPDSLAYVVRFDNGATWPVPRTYTQLNKDTQAWTTVTVAVPAGSTHARLRLAVRQNGNDDWVAFDQVSLGQGTVAVPTPDLGFTGSATPLIVAETAGSVSIPLSIRNANATASTVQAVVAPLGTATAGADFTFATPQTLTFTPGSTTPVTLTLPITDDATAEPAEYFTVRLQNPTNATLTAGATEFLVFIKDNDTQAPARAGNLRLNLLGSYQNGVSGTNSAEIVAHDPTTQRLYVANSIGGKLDILNFAAPGAITPVASVSMAPYGGINSVAVRNGLVVCAVEDAVLQNPGKLVFFDQNGSFIKQLTTGALPDMVTFSPDGRYVISANEGEPNQTYTNDPLGSVTVVDVSSGIANVTQANATTVDFSGYNSQAAALRAAGIRIYGGPTTAPASSVAQDLEPEYVAVSADSRTAYIGLQENNAIATLDLATLQFTSLRPIGYQDHSQPGFSFDASDQAADVLLANWPVRGMRQPDAIASFELPAALGGGRYLITANEGDARDYDGGYSEVVRLGAAGYVLDPTAFPQAATLKNNSALGRLNVTNRLGDTDGDGDFDEIYAFGGRSFSILNATTGALVHDSGDLLERLTSTDPTFGSIFNASNTTGNPVRKNRSDDKGPEPEGTTIGMIRDTVYAFISLERQGGVLVMNVNDPANPRLVQYINNRSLTTGTGDQGPEGLVFVSAANSPTGQPLLLLANEVSSTVAVYQIGLRGVLSTAAARAAAPLYLYPNPSQGGRVQLSRPVSGTLHDVLGRPVRTLAKAQQFETAGLAPGVYVLRAEDGASSKLVVR
ncbi:choice-of-anchor I family protein [Hymenobacter sp. BT186]|uniref:Choice-of-anchor I family protein n=1 Tax=Hymenobacter telluris TaxID=2816474 RepID=A0A939EVB3_9BACT|nr:choice-of-anchor I family protein [Hymenobacter telluris]MBO0357887.1 choice-of-anchor I family protein [Hymenobacter telluris]MBW3373914.1 choice-of-anchor I family protein [Hymenobacter norwichensis]